MKRFLFKRCVPVLCALSVVIGLLAVPVQAVSAESDVVTVEYMLQELEEGRAVETFTVSGSFSANTTA